MTNPFISQPGSYNTNHSLFPDMLEPLVYQHSANSTSNQEQPADALSDKIADKVVAKSKSKHTLEKKLNSDRQPRSIFPEHEREWVDGSGVSRQITHLNVYSLEDNKEIAEKLGWKIYGHTAGWFCNGVNPITGQEVTNGVGQFTPPEQEVTEPDPVLDIPKPTDFEFVPGKSTQSVPSESVSTESIPPEPGSGSAARIFTSEYSCTKGGFTGTIRLDYQRGGPFNTVGLIYEVSYKINKGGNRGGNSANVSYGDYANAPKTEFATGDDGIQDNQWHYLGGPYSRASGDIGAKFIFDKSFAPDPSCGLTIPLDR